MAVFIFRSLVKCSLVSVCSHVPRTLLWAGQQDGSSLGTGACSVARAAASLFHELVVGWEDPEWGEKEELDFPEFQVSTSEACDQGSGQATRPVWAFVTFSAKRA